MTGRLRIKSNLLVNFSIISLLITAAIATSLAFGIQKHLEQNQLRQVAESAADQVSTILNPNLRVSDLENPLSLARYDQIAKIILENILHKHVVRVKIWNLEGRLIYANEENIVGRHFPMSEELREALEGKMAMEISDLRKEENVAERGQFDRLLEVYTPLQPLDSNRIEGAYEIYYDLANLQPHVTRMRRFVWAGVGLGFFILYGSLFTLVRGASRELIRRNEENKRLFELEQMRRMDLGALYDLSRNLADVFYDSQAILNFITRHAVEITHITFSRILLLEGDQFVVQAVYPVRIIGHDLAVGYRDSVKAYPYCRRILEQNIVVIIHRDNPDISYYERKALFLDIAQTICIVPLYVGDSLLGFMVLSETRSEEREPFTEDKLRLARSIGDQAASALHRVQLYMQLENAYEQTVLALANAVDARDTYTGDHSDRLAAMSLSIGRDLGMDDHELEDLRYGALLHDIGKIGVSDSVLLKPAKLTEDEWIVMRRHPIIGAEILKPVPRLARAADIVRHHHESLDGKGYPHGLKGEEIPLGARILTVVDSYWAIRDKRFYKESRSHQEALQELQKCTGSQFDPRVIEIVLKMFNKELVP